MPKIRWEQLPPYSRAISSQQKMDKDETTITRNNVASRWDNFAQ